MMRDTMATLLWEIWEDDAQKHGVAKRRMLAPDYWKQFVDELVSEWPGYRLQDNEEQRYHSRFELEVQQIKHDLADIRPTMRNAFLFDKRLKGRI